MRYEPALDGLRAVAIIAVVLLHSTAVQGGYIGVDLFFVLSGFLITSLLAAEWQKSGQIDLRRFYVRRWLRLGPPLLLMLGVWLLWAPFVWPDENHLLSAAIASAYVADYVMPLFGQPRHLGHMWSLAIEEQFYLIWPLLVVSLLRFRRPALLLCAAYIAVTAWRWSFTELGPLYNRLDTHCSGLILGCALYFIRYRPSAATTYAAMASFLLLCLFAPNLYWQITPGLFAVSFIITLGELLAFVLIAGACFTDHPFNAALSSKPMVLIGRLSYGIYLWHAPITWAIRNHLPMPATVAIVSVLSVAAAAASYVTVEA